MGFWLEWALNSLPRGFPIVRVTRRELFCFVCRARMWIEPEKKNVRQNTSLFFFVILSSWHTFSLLKAGLLLHSQIQRKCIMQMYTFQEMGTLKAFQTLPVMYFPDHHVPGCVLISVHPDNASLLPLWRGDLLDPYFSRFFLFYFWFLSSHLHSHYSPLISCSKSLFFLAKEHLMIPYFLAQNKY